MIRSSDATLKKYGIKKMPIIEVLLAAEFDGIMKALDTVERQSWFGNEFNKCIHLSEEDFKLIRQDFIRLFLEESKK